MYYSIDTHLSLSAKPCRFQKPIFVQQPPTILRMFSGVRLHPLQHLFAVAVVTSNFDLLLPQGFLDDVKGNRSRGDRSIKPQVYGHGMEQLKVGIQS